MQSICDYALLLNDITNNLYARNENVDGFLVISQYQLMIILNLTVNMYCSTSRVGRYNNRRADSFTGNESFNYNLVY